MNRILVTGANGNLGRKLISHMLERSGATRIVGLDLMPAEGSSNPRVTSVAGDLGDAAGTWRDALRDVDAVVHFAARNPYPDASWADSAASVDMTLNLIAAAAALGVGRVVFASSNHVMGGYKEIAKALAPGSISPDCDPWPGTRSVVDGKVHDRPAYAVAKLMGERALAAATAATALTAVSLRIGWCQPGPNDPATITAAGNPKAGREPEGAEAHDLRWFRQMWLSNADFCGLFSAALLADSASWPARAIVVNAMSNNAGTPWNLGPTRRLLGYAPVDNVWPSLGLAPPVDASGPT